MSTPLGLSNESEALAKREGPHETKKPRRKPQQSPAEAPESMKETATAASPSKNNAEEIKIESVAEAKPKVRLTVNEAGQLSVSIKVEEQDPVKESRQVSFPI